MTNASHAMAMTADELRHQTTLGEEARPAGNRLIGLGLVLVLGSLLYGWFTGHEGWRQFQHSYLVAFTFFLSITLGSLWFVTIHHLVGAKWSVTVRRIAEVTMGSMPLLAVLFLPILVPVLAGSHALFEWANPELMATDHLLHEKAPFLNVPFFAIRCVLYFAIWIGFSRFFVGNSRAQDLNGDPGLTARMRRRAPLSIILFAVSTTFAAFDLLMALEPHWFSTIFGVYFFAGCALSFFCSTALAVMLAQERGRLRGIVTTEHFHDLGKWMFAFVFFWGYIAFSQFMLIWYANIPEETIWFQRRFEGSWSALAVLLLFGHLLIPFAGLLSRHVKRNKGPLAFWAIALLFMHWVDLYWIVMPVLHREGVGFHALDATAMLGIGGLYVGLWLRRAQNGLIAPVRDPFWHESLAFKNA